MLQASSLVNSLQLIASSWYTGGIPYTTTERVMRLTKKTVTELQSRPKRYYEWDEKIPGFGVGVHPSGRKSFYYKYRNAANRQKMYTIGPFGKLTVEQARGIAKDLSADVRKGKDPATKKKDMREGTTVSEACDRFVKEHVFLKKENTKDQKDSPCYNSESCWDTPRRGQRKDMLTL